MQTYVNVIAKVCFYYLRTILESFLKRISHLQTFDGPCSVNCNDIRRFQNFTLKLLIFVKNDHISFIIYPMAISENET